MTTLEQMLEEIEAREAKATEGPWEVDAGGYVVTTDKLPVLDRCHYDGDQYRATSAGMPNMEFIANARTDIPRLVKALRKAIEQRNIESETASAELGALSCHDHITKQQDAELISILRGS